MAVTLAPDGLRDAEVTDGIGLGDIGCAARLWVRYWPTALGAARQFVDPAEVPGLAAEALIGTIAAIAIGRGPREDVAGFVAAAVRELGEDDEPTTRAETAHYPEVFASAMMTRAFAALDDDTRHRLHGEGDDYALTVLQHYYLAEHSDDAPTAACRRAHVAMMSAADGSAKDGLSGETWLHLSTCAWCTEAFHEVAFSNVALASLIAADVWDQAPVLPMEVDDLAAVAPLPPEEITAKLAESMPHAAAPEEAHDEPLPFEAGTVDPPAEDLPAPEEDELAEPRRRRRGALLLAGAAIAAAVVAVGAVVASGLGGEDTAPSASTGDPTESTAADLPTESPSVMTRAPFTPASPSDVAATVAGPLATATASATVSSEGSPTPTPTPTASAKPTAKPTTKPSPTSGPTSAPPTTSTPSPTATPTERCNGLQHLLGMC